MKTGPGGVEVARPLVVDRRARDVGRHQVGRELDAREPQLERPRRTSGHERLREPGDVLDQDVAAGEERHQHELDSSRLPITARSTSSRTRAAGRAQTSSSSASAQMRSRPSSTARKPVRPSPRPVTLAWQSAVGPDELPDGVVEHLARRVRPPLRGRCRAGRRALSQDSSGDAAGSGGRTRSPRPVSPRAPPAPARGGGWGAAGRGKASSNAESFMRQAPVRPSHRAARGRERPKA